MERRKFKSVDEFIDTFSGETKKRLEQLRACVFKIAPKATERISYNIPAYFIDNKMLIYFAGYEQHVSLYPGRTASKEYTALAKEYASGASTLKFPNDKPLPLDLIEDFIRLRLQEVSAG